MYVCVNKINKHIEDPACIISSICLTYEPVHIVAFSLPSEAWYSSMARASHWRSEGCGFDSRLGLSSKHFSEFALRLSSKQFIHNKVCLLYSLSIVALFSLRDGTLNCYRYSFWEKSTWQARQLNLSVWVCGQSRVADRVCWIPWPWRAFRCSSEC